MDLTPEIREEIEDRARTEGFDIAGIARADAIPDASARLDAFLAAGYAGEMTWLHEKADRRRSPNALWPEARSVIMLAQNYHAGLSPLDRLTLKDRANISVYALGRDYHDVVKKKLKRVARWLHQAHDAEVKVFVDTAPVMEKPLAAAAGLGWQGKHTNLVTRSHGSWTFLGAIYTTLTLPPSGTEEDHCGACRRCLDICPTNAFPAPYQLDARRCISYLTIEYPGHIPIEFRKPMGNRIYGCDDCLAICPWNKFAETSREAKLAPRAELIAPRLRDLAALDDAGFRDLFSGSPIKRTGRDRFVRNVLIAIGNSCDKALSATAEALLDDASPLVRAMAVWALGELAPDRARALAESMHDTEQDSGVLEEWARIRG
jgi:epoxyqueuosine reductase